MNTEELMRRITAKVMDKIKESLQRSFRLCTKVLLTPDVSMPLRGAYRFFHLPNLCL